MRRNDIVIGTSSVPLYIEQNFFSSEWVSKVSRKNFFQIGISNKSTRIASSDYCIQVLYLYLLSPHSKLENIGLL